MATITFCFYRFFKRNLAEVSYDDFYKAAFKIRKAGATILYSITGYEAIGHF